MQWAYIRIKLNKLQMDVCMCVCVYAHLINHPFQTLIKKVHDLEAKMPSRDQANRPKAEPAKPTAHFQALEADAMLFRKCNVYPNKPSQGC